MLDCYKAKRKKQPFTVLPDGREISNTEADWQRRRKECHDREQGLCETCKDFSPLHNTEEAFAGHAHHLFGRKNNDDRSIVLRWLCGNCHDAIHVPKKVVPKKFKEVA
jgi:hypothetical protein